MMLRNFSTIAFVVMLTAACDRSQGSATASHPGARAYLQNCANCHGATMQGGNGGPLLGIEWKHGDDLYKTIAEGIPQLGMPAYGETLSSTDIRLIVNYIEEARAEGTVTAPPAQSLRSLDKLETLDYEVAVDVWVEGLDVPWGMVFLDERRALVTERRGTLRMVIDGELLSDPVEGIPATLQRGQGGLMDVAVDRQHVHNGWIYLGYTHSNDGRNAQTRVVRGRLDGNRWIDEELLYEAPPESYSGAGVHFGTRIVFDEQGYLYFAIGDRGAQNTAQLLTSPNGKIHRIYPDGGVPSDNPFADVEGALPTIWSYGHRNPQGLAFHPVTGGLWDAEHGPRGGDEINLVKRGLNYGWPVITYGINYNGSIISRDRVHPEMEQPVWYWRPSTGLCAIQFYTGDQFPLWENRILAGALVNETLRLLNVQNDRVIHEEIILQGKGRIRDVCVGPDGAIYLVMNDPHNILRLSSIRENIR